MQVYNKSSRYSQSQRLLTPLRTVVNKSITKNNLKKYNTKNLGLKVNYCESLKKPDRKGNDFSGFKHPRVSSMFMFESPFKTSRPSTRKDIRFISNFKIRDFNFALGSLETMTQLSINSSISIQIDKKIDKQIQTLSNDQINALYKARCNDLQIQIFLTHLQKFKAHCQKNCRNNQIILSSLEIGSYSIITISDILLVNHQITHLDISKNQIGDKGISILSKVLPVSVSLVHLDVSSTLISKKGANHLFNKLKDNCTVTCLFLSSSVKHIRNSLKGIKLNNLFEYLGRSNQLTFFQLDGVLLSDEGVEILYQGLKENESVSHLSIANNQISDKSSKIILYILQLKKMHLLNIDGNHLSDSFIYKFSEESKLSNNMSANVLSMKECGFTSKVMHKLMNSFNLSNSLSEILLDRNPINSEESSYFVSLFKENIVIQKLSLQYCDIGNNGAFFIGIGLSKCDHFQVLNLGFNCIEDEGAKSLAVSLQIHPGELKNIDLSYNKISNEGAMPIIELLNNNSNLEFISFEANHLYLDIAKFIYDNIWNNTKIKNINLKCNNIDTKFIVYIEKIFKKNRGTVKSSKLFHLHNFISEDENSYKLIPEISRTAQQVYLKSLRDKEALEYQTDLFNLEKNKGNPEIKRLEEIKDNNIIKINQINLELKKLDQEISMKTNEYFFQYGKKSKEVSENEEYIKNLHEQSTLT